MTVPEQYTPKADKPWRVTWGFGAFQDFATKEEAEVFYDEKRLTLYRRLARKRARAI